jgi:plastocyanin
MGVPPSAQKQFNERYSADVDDFFPHGITIHVGDSLRFVPANFHTVDLPARGQKPLSLIVPAGTKANESDAAGAPFWFNGQSNLGFNPVVLRSSFGRRLAYTGAKRVESGLPIQNRPKPMLVRFSRAGRFTFYCDVHPGMKGTVRVVSRRHAISSARQDARTVRAQVTRDLAIAKTLAPSAHPAPNVVQVGAAGVHGVELLGFLPQTLNVPVGTTVTFTMPTGSVEAHTATTGPGDPEKDPTSYLGKLAASFNSPVFDPAAVYPSDPPPAAAAFTASSHGNGFWNSGVLDSVAASPLPQANRVTFSQAGTYTFHCLIHPFMQATVVVS